LTALLCYHSVLFYLERVRYSSMIKSIIIVSMLVFIVGCDSVDVPVGRMPPVLALGERAPDFDYYPLVESELNADKKSEKLTSQFGKVIYLDFWASWCLPCIKSMPLLNQLRSELGYSGFEMIAVNLDDVLEKGIDFLQEHTVAYPVVRAADENISELYQLNGLPTSYLIDRQGVLRYAHQGFKEQDMPQIRQQVLALLN